MADELQIQKITISGSTLVSIIERFASAPGDVDGLLFGHLSSLPPPPLSDDDPAPSAPTSPLAAAVTGHFCSGAPSTFHDPLGRVDRSAVLVASHRPAGGPHLIGWFSGRRLTPLRPSMRDYAASLSLSQTLTLDEAGPEPRNKALVFILLSSSYSTSNVPVHTHEYRAFVLRRGRLEPCSIDVVNVGPAFRGQYGSFSAESPFPLVACRARGVEEDEGVNKASIGYVKQSVREQQMLDSCAEGFGLEQLRQMAGHGAAAYTSGVEVLYEKMLLKLESLARMVEASSAEVLKKENRNLLLRSKLAGLE